MISRERLYIANKKGRRRAKGLSIGVTDSNGFVRVWESGGDTVFMNSQEWINHTSKVLRNTTKRCSKACCGNPRKFFGETTKQEKISDDIYRQWICELGG